MPNQLDADGLQVATADEQTTAIQDSLKSIFGTDINLASNSPDGQLIGILVQAMQDFLDLLVNIYNGFSVSSAYGTSLHQLVAINGLAIQGGTYTTTPVEITADRALTLPGLDQDVALPFLVKDVNNIWTLISSYSFGGAATQALVFRCDEMGPIQPLSNTIVNIATPTLGITDSNNPPSTLVDVVIGQNEETDVALRVRHGKSFKLAATCPADSIEAALLAIPTATDALVVENDTAAPVGVVPAHSVWPIVVGGTSAEIAAAIYAKKAPGCGLYGAVSQVVARPNGLPATMYWDTGVEQRLYAQFDIIPTVTGVTFDEDLIKQELAAALLGHFNLAKPATLGDIVRAMYGIEPRAILVSTGVSTDGMSYSDTVTPTSSKYYFSLAAADIDIT